MASLKWTCDSCTAIFDTEEEALQHELKHAEYIDELDEENTKKEELKAKHPVGSTVNVCEGILDELYDSVIEGISQNIIAVFDDYYREEIKRNILKADFEVIDYDDEYRDAEEFIYIVRAKKFPVDINLSVELQIYPSDIEENRV
jgi:hypothetical protein